LGNCGEYSWTIGTSNITKRIFETSRFFSVFWCIIWLCLIKKIVAHRSLGTVGMSRDLMTNYVTKCHKSVTFCHKHVTFCHNFVTFSHKKGHVICDLLGSQAKQDTIMMWLCPFQVGITKYDQIARWWLGHVIGLCGFGSTWLGLGLYWCHHYVDLPWSMSE
jgi:hypothetical protein